MVHPVHGAHLSHYSCPECLESNLGRLKKMYSATLKVVEFPDTHQQREVDPDEYLARVKLPPEPDDDPAPQFPDEPDDADLTGPLEDGGVPPEPADPDPRGEVVVVFDIETTGLEIGKDRIVQFAARKIVIGGDGSEDPLDNECLEFTCSPGMPIPKAASDIHGITDDSVRDLPFFKGFAQRVADFIGDHPLAGYNIRNFDVPFLWEELNRCGIQLMMGGRPIIDSYVIFSTKEPRTLEAAVKRYCGREHKDAHDAAADVIASADVLFGQLSAYDDLTNMTVAELHKTFDDGRIDLAGKIKANEAGNPAISFGKHRDKEIAWILKNDRSYLNWMVNQSDMPSQSRKVLACIVEDLEAQGL